MQHVPALRRTGAKTKLRTRFIALLAGTMVLCVAGLSLIWEPRIVRVMSTAQVQNLDSKIEILSDSLVSYLLQNQYGAIFETLDSTKARNENWRQVTLTGAGGVQLYPLFDTLGIEGDDTISTRKAIAFEGKTLAVLTVGADISNELDKIRRQVRTLTILMSLFFLSSLLVLGLLFERWVVRRVTLLAAAAKQMSLGNYDASIPHASQDEIGVLTDSFRFMRLTIKENQEKLIASRDEAQHAAQAKSRFLAMMSHEIRTPLNGILPTAELLLESDLPKEQRHLVATIQDSGKSLKAIINDILDVSKLEEGKFELRNEAFSIGSLLNSILGMFDTAAKKKNVVLETTSDFEGPNLLLGDETRIRQVLANLVGNAIKFTPEGNITLGVAHKVAAKGGVEVEFMVKDTGIGISQEDTQSIFERFSQVDNRSNREYQGSGLGLAICKQLVTAMGGELRVQSKPGSGSKFFFTLRLNVASPEEASDQGLLVNNEFATNPPGHQHSYHVLVVDDNKTNLKIAKIILASLNHTAKTARSGHEAIAMLGKESFDLVLLDVNMPGIDGYETARRIRSGSPQLSNTVILGHSASAFKDDIDRCIDAGMDGFLPKPLSKKELFSALQTHLAAASNSNTEDHSASGQVKPIPSTGDGRFSARAKHQADDLAPNSE
ncbi:ATP-binding protein [Thalassovita sp.]|uniref:ATP-binding protein n=1 Tax=Thalassovita sp. TaxID=1979401 RepID=UPI003B58EC29